MNLDSIKILQNERISLNISFGQNNFSYFICKFVFHFIKIPSREHPLFKGMQLEISWNIDVFLHSYLELQKSQLLSLLNRVDLNLFCSGVELCTPSDSTHFSTQLKNFKQSFLFSLATKFGLHPNLVKFFIRFRTKYQLRLTFYRSAEHILSTTVWAFEMICSTLL